MKDLVKWQVLQQMPGFIAVLAGRDHVFEFVNDAYVALVGPRTYIGRTARAVFADLRGNCYFDALDHVYTTGVSYEAKAMELSFEGAEVKFIDFRYQPIKNEVGEVSGIFVSGSDVTERVKAEEKLRKSEARLAALLQASSEVRYLMNADWSSMIQLSGSGFLAATSAPDGHWREKYIHPEDQPMVDAAIAHAVANRQTFQLEHRVLLPSGLTGWTSSRAVPITDADGNIIEWFGAASDVSVRRRAEDELRKANAELEKLIARAVEERHLYADIIETTDAAVQVLDTDFRILAINRANIEEYEKAFGISPKVGDKLLDLIGDDAMRAHLAAVWQRTFDGEDFIITGPFGDPKAGRRFYETRFRHLTLGGKRMSYCIGYDITQRMEEQERLRQIGAQLRQAQKMEAVGQLTGGLAHDFNNLLTGVMGNLELLQRRVAMGKLEGLDRYVLGAQGAGKRAAALTQRLLAFSRRQTLDPKPTDVNRLVVEMEEMLKRTVGPAISLEFQGAVGLWAANIDAGQLENSLLNLCINARDAMPGGGSLTIHTKNETFSLKEARENDLQPGQYVAVAVADNGTGMSDETVSRAFEPFYTTKPIGQGTGLGLSMIYGFARQSGGSVKIHSKLGLGSKICIYLPRHVSEKSEDSVAQAAMAPPTQGCQTVLVVDDEATIRTLVEEVLKDMNYSVISAPDGPSGIRMLESGVRVNLLITDVGLPNGMNGRQVADAARLLVPGLKVLFITGYAESAAIGNGDLEAGMELLTKPFSLEALGVKVQAILTSREPAERAAS